MHISYLGSENINIYIPLIVVVIYLVVRLLVCFSLIAKKIVLITCPHFLSHIKSGHQSNKIEIFDYYFIIIQ